MGRAQPWPTHSKAIVREITSRHGYVVPIAVRMQFDQGQATGDLDVIQFAVVSIAVQDPGKLHDLCLFINGIDDPIFALGDPETG